MSRKTAAALALLLASGVARAEVEGEPHAGPSPEHVTSSAEDGQNASRRGRPPVGLLGFGADFGGSPEVKGGKVGLGFLRGGGPVTSELWMAWLEYDTTGRFRPRRPPGAGRTDQIGWIHPHLEYGRQLVRASLLFGWVQAGPTLGVYTAGERDVWFPGVAAAAGIQWMFFRVGVRYYGQWRRASVSAAGPGASGAVRMEPMIFVTAGVEAWLPAVP